MNDYADQLLNEVRKVMVLTDSVPMSIVRDLINSAHDEGVKEGMETLFGPVSAIEHRPISKHWFSNK